MAEDWPWAGRIVLATVCRHCGRETTCITEAVVTDGPLCFACAAEYNDLGIIGQYLVWEELRRLCALLEQRPAALPPGWLLSPTFP